MTSEELKTQARPETGPMQFGSDWPGLFIRGDNCAYYAMLLEMYLNGQTDEMTKKQLEGFLHTLRTSNMLRSEYEKNEVQYLKKWEDCV